MLRWLAVVPCVMLMACQSPPSPESLPALEFAQTLAKAQRYDEAVARYLPVRAEHTLPAELELEFWQLRRKQHEIETLGYWSMPKPLARAPLVKWQHPPDFDELSYHLRELANNDDLDAALRQEAYTDLLRAANNEGDYRWVTLSAPEQSRCDGSDECVIQEMRFQFFQNNTVDGAMFDALLTKHEKNWRYGIYAAIANYHGDFAEFLSYFVKSIELARISNEDPWVVRQLSAYRRYLADNYLIAQL